MSRDSGTSAIFGVLLGAGLVGLVVYLVRKWSEGQLGPNGEENSGLIPDEYEHTVTIEIPGLGTSGTAPAPNGGVDWFQTILSGLDIIGRALGFAGAASLEQQGEQLPPGSYSGYYFDVPGTGHSNLPGFSSPDWL